MTDKSLSEWPQIITHMISKHLWTHRWCWSYWSGRGAPELHQPKTVSSGFTEEGHWWNEKWSGVHSKSNYTFTNGQQNNQRYLVYVGNTFNFWHYQAANRLVFPSVIIQSKATVQKMFDLHAACISYRAGDCRCESKTTGLQGKSQKRYQNFLISQAGHEL